MSITKGVAMAARGPGQRGVTLIELVIFIVVVSIAVVGLLQIFTRTTASSADPQLRKQALAIAEAMLDEIEGARFTFCDPIKDPAADTAQNAALFHIATNLARDQLRRRIRTDRVLAEIADADLHSPPADTVAAARQEISQLADVLAGLPARPREILILSRVEGLSHAEIGAQLGIATKTVENHVGRALAMLAQRLGPARGRS